MSVSDIAGEISVNRNTVSRYLDMLLISGQVEMKTYGKAKVFYLSQRVPISSMMNFASDMVFVLDRDFIVVETNDALCRFVQEKREVICGIPMRDSALVAFDHPLITARLRDAMEGTESVDELRYVRVDGELFYRVKIIPTVLNSGIPGVTVMLEDITERRRAEEALRESEQKYRALVEQINDAIWIIDDDWTFNYASPRTERILGYEPEDLLGRRIFDYLLPGEEERVIARLTDAAEEGNGGAVITVAMRHHDGHTIDVEASISPEFDELGNLAGFRAVCRDVSERRAAARRVLKWKTFLHSILQNIPAMVFVTESRTHNIIFFNRSFKVNFGADADLITGKRCVDIFPPALCRVLATGDNEAITTRQEFETDRMPCYIPGKGERTVSIKKVPLFSSSGELKYVLGIVKDVTATE
ncbi:hypothetical protein AZH53_08740 [Methanomicrobiaceae archaeon CYW5]|nr:hypothetical protein [Methanovulcanius yangii]